MLDILQRQESATGKTTNIHSSYMVGLHFTLMASKLPIHDGTNMCRNLFGKHWNITLIPDQPRIHWRSTPDTAPQKNTINIQGSIWTAVTVNGWMALPRKESSNEKWPRLGVNWYQMFILLKPLQVHALNRTSFQPEHASVMFGKHSVSSISKEVRLLFFFSETETRTSIAQDANTQFVKLFPCNNLRIGCKTFLWY